MINPLIGKKGSLFISFAIQQEELINKKRHVSHGTKLKTKQNFEHINKTTKVSDLCLFSFFFVRARKFPRKFWLWSFPLEFSNTRRKRKGRKVIPIFEFFLLFSMCGVLYNFFYINPKSHGKKSNSYPAKWQVKHQQTNDFLIAP